MELHSSSNIRLKSLFEPFLFLFFGGKCFYVCPFSWSFRPLSERPIVGQKSDIFRQKVTASKEQSTSWMTSKFYYNNLLSLVRLISLKMHLSRVAQLHMRWVYKMYSARRLIGSRIIESAAYCNQILLAPLCMNSTQNMSVHWIIRLLLSLLGRSKVIIISGGHCIN